MRRSDQSRRPLCGSRTARSSGARAKRAKAVVGLTVIAAMSLALPAYAATNSNASARPSNTPAHSAASTGSDESQRPWEKGLERDAQAGSLLPESVRKTGVITIATFPDYPPGQFAKSGSNTLIGWNIDLIHALQTVLGVRLRIRTTTFGALIPGLKSGRFDMAMAEMNITPKRVKAVDFVSYFNNEVGLIVAKDSDIHAQNPSGLCGQSVGIETGASPLQGLQEGNRQCKAKGKKGINIVSFPGINAGLLAIRAGRIQVFATDYPALAYVVDHQPDKFRLSSKKGYDPVTAGIAFPKGSGLPEAFAAAMNKLIGNGTYAAILKHWNVSNGAIKKSVINPDS